MMITKNDVDADRVAELLQAMILTVAVGGFSNEEFFTACRFALDVGEDLLNEIKPGSAHD